MKTHLAAALLFVLLTPAHAWQHAPRPATYLGFDRNEYPGDAALPALRATFAFTGYWLNNPPGASSNSWQGKRLLLQRAGFGFLVLFNGRTFAELTAASVDPDTTAVALADAASATHSARAEGFPPGTILFLDQEEGGRMLPQQKQYIFAWAEAVRRAGYRPGIYCSGIPIPEASGASITTARDLHESPQGASLVFWVANDACPPSPGCTLHPAPPPPAASGAPFAEVWQFAQSPLRRQFAAACAATYAPDGNCYPPASTTLHLDLNSSSTPDPSHARD